MGAREAVACCGKARNRTFYILNNLRQLGVLIKTAAVCAHVDIKIFADRVWLQL